MLTLDCKQTRCPNCDSCQIGTSIHQPLVESDNEIKTCYYCGGGP